MKQIQVNDWRTGMESYLFAETGEGALYRVAYIRDNCDCNVVTVSKAADVRSMFTQSWACCPDSTLFVFDSAADRDHWERELQRRLAARRERWSAAARKAVTV